MERAKLRRNIASAIRRWRTDGELARTHVGNHVGVCGRTVQRWENGATEPNITDLILMESLRPGIVKAIFALKA